MTYEFPPFVGGIGKYAEELARAASEAGNQVMVVAPTFNQPCDDDSKYPFHIKRFQSGIYRSRNISSLLFRTRRILSEEDADIIHAVDIPFTMALAYLQKHRHFKFISSVHGAASMTVRDSSSAKILGVTDLYKRAERVCANSAFTKKLLLEYFPDIPADHVTVAHLGVNRSWFAPVDPAAITSMRKRFGIKPNNKIILTVARLDRRKGHQFVFEAIEKLPEETKRNLTYLIVGEGNDRAYSQELHELANKSGTQVIFSGSLKGEELRSVYAGAAVFCMPGDSTPPGAEGFGLVYLEAAAMGVPSVAFNIAAVPEVIRNGETGLLVPHNDINALASALGKLINDPEETRRLGVAAKEWASKFTWARCAELTYGNLS